MEQEVNSSIPVLLFLLARPFFCVDITVRVRLCCNEIVSDIARRDPTQKIRLPK